MFISFFRKSILNILYMGLFKKQKKSVALHNEVIFYYICN